jgi:hypothetical protein
MSPINLLIKHNQPSFIEELQQKNMRLNDKLAFLINRLNTEKTENLHYMK